MLGDHYRLDAPIDIGSSLHAKDLNTLLCVGIEIQRFQEGGVAPGEILNRNIYKIDRVSGTSLNVSLETGRRCIAVRRNQFLPR